MQFYYGPKMYWSACDEAEGHSFFRGLHISQKVAEDQSVSTF
jgi:hypothetical protein